MNSQNGAGFLFVEVSNAESMRRIVVGVSGFILAVFLLGGLAAGIGAAQTADTGTNASFGAEVSSFMQASEAEAESEVDNEMFETALNRTEDPDERRALIEQREQRLEERHQELRAQRSALDGAPNVRAHAVATRVAVGAGELERSVNETAKMAAKAGVEARGLDALQSNARGLRDSDVEALTPAIAGQPGVVRGPPNGVSPGNGPNADRPGGNASRPADTAANRSNSSNARGVNRSGPPQGQAGKNGTEPANGSQQGAPAGPGDASGNANGNSNDNGNNNSNDNGNNNSNDNDNGPDQNARQDRGGGRSGGQDR